MRQHVIAVEDGLTSVSNELRQRGHEVVSIDHGAAPHADVLVITGGDENIMGMMDVKIDVPVIVAEGRSAQDICDEVDARLHRVH